MTVRAFVRVDERLYRSGQPQTGEWPALYGIGIRAVLSLNESEDLDARAAGLHVTHIYLPDAETQSELRDPNILDVIDAVVDVCSVPMLVHCTEGVDRTGIVVARYRVRRQGWTKRAARDEWEAAGSHCYAGLVKAWNQWTTEVPR